ncbi:MAG TPA: MBL fold metallo-hydrolase [Euzebya sp.]|nr:MBL fold metallo-hydrolase [Euzebya sp.]
MPRQLVVLGTASMAPTRERNHNGHLLRWDDLGILFDPGEGTQRQLLLAGERSSSITHIAITHRHGDHLLGLPGILQRMALDQRRSPLVLIHPAHATTTIDHLLALGLYQPAWPIIRKVLPDDAPTSVQLDDTTSLQAVPLDHRVPALGYRIVEAAGLRVDPHRLALLDMGGPVVGRLLREGQVHHGGRMVAVEEVTLHRQGQAMAFVMDTRSCDAVEELLADADLGVVEATFLDADEDAAESFGHLTAGQAGRHAAAAGVRRLVLTHFSQRYGDVGQFADQARCHHSDVVAAVDLDRIDVPARLTSAVGS